MLPRNCHPAWLHEAIRTDANRSEPAQTICATALGLHAPSHICSTASPCTAGAAAALIADCRCGMARLTLCLYRWLLIAGLGTSRASAASSQQSSVALQQAFTQAIAANNTNAAAQTVAKCNRLPVQAKPVLHAAALCHCICCCVCSA